MQNMRAGIPLLLSLLVLARAKKKHERQCEQLPAAANGSYRCTNFWYLHSTCAYSCDDGFHLYDSCISYNTCIDDGYGDLMWEMADMDCRPDDCPRPNVVTGGKYSPHKDTYGHGEQVTLVCSSGYTMSGSQASTATCVAGKFLPPLTATCIKDCAKPLVIGGSYSPDKQSYSHNDQLQIKCLAGYSSSVARSTATCKNGVFSPNLAIVCYLDCSKPAVVGGSYTPDGASYAHATVVSFQCGVGYTLKSGSQPISSKCVNGTFDKKTAVTCLKDDPDLDCLFVVSDASTVDNCAQLEGDLGKLAPFTHAELEASGRKNYLRQWEVIKYIEENYVISNENRTHFGVMKDDDGDCEDSVSRAFSQSHLGPHALPNLVAADKYKCDSFKFDKLVGCILRSGFEGHTMTRKHVAVIFTAGDDLTSTVKMRRAIWYWKKNFLVHLLDIRFIVMETRLRTHAGYEGSKEYFEQLLGDGSYTTRTTVFSGAFIGSTWDPLQTILSAVVAAVQ